MSLEPLTELHSRFKIIDRLGSGAIGTVYKARDLELNGQVVALKVLHDHLLADERTLQRFRNEVILSRKVVHPNVARIFDLATGADGRQFIVMEYVDGCTLRARLDRSPNGLSSAEVVRIVTALCDGLQAAHDCGIVHRDLKPDNVLIAADGSVKIADLGLARRLDDAHGLTRTGESLGTAYYMAPEQVKGKDATTLSDLYAVGIIAFELLTGSRPFDGTSYFAVIDGHLNDRLGDPRLHSKSIPGWWWKILLAATEKNPRRRFKSARLLGDRIRTAASRTGASRLVQSAADSGYRLMSGLLTLPMKLLLAALIFAVVTLIPTRILAERRSTRVAVLSRVIRAEQLTGIPLWPFRVMLRYHRVYSTDDLSVYVLQDDDMSVQIALELGVDPKKRLPDGRSLLQYALGSGALKTAPVLLNYGADPNDSAIGTQTPLCLAATMGFPHIVRMLVDKGAKIDAADQLDNTALHYAAGTGNLYAVAFLLSRGARPDLPNVRGDTPYHYAVSLPFCPTCPQWVRDEGLRLMAHYGGNPDARNLVRQSVAELASSLNVELHQPRERVTERAGSEGAPAK